MARVHDVKDQFLNWIWRPEYRSPDQRRLAKALAWSLGIHFCLMLFSGNNGNSGSMEGLVRGIRSASEVRLPRSAPAFLIVHLADERHPIPLDRPDSQTPPSPVEPRVDVSVSAKPAATTSNNRSTEASHGTDENAGQSQRLPSSSATNEETALLARRAGYALANLLDISPYPLEDIKPEYPNSAGNQRGSVVLRLFINEDGGVDELVVVRATPRGFFEEAALTAFAKGHFSPGMKTGRAVKSQLAVEVEFTPFNRGAEVSGHSY